MPIAPNVRFAFSNRTLGGVRTDDADAPKAATVDSGNIARAKRADAGGAIGGVQQVGEERVAANR